MGQHQARTVEEEELKGNKREHEKKEDEQTRGKFYADNEEGWEQPWGKAGIPLLSTFYDLPVSEAGDRESQKSEYKKMQLQVWRVKLCSLKTPGMSFLIPPDFSSNDIFSVFHRKPYNGYTGC